MKPGSLRLRLVAGGALAIGLALLVAGAGLATLFERHLMRSLASELELDLWQALAAVELDATGRPLLAREPLDARFREPLSGLYWQLSSEPGGMTRSRSLWDVTLPLPRDELAAGEVHQHEIAGPGGARLLAVERTINLKWNDGRRPVRIVVAADLAKITDARRSFVGDLALSLALLGLVLAAATWVQISLGLKPLARVREGITAIRSGDKRDLPHEVPSEVFPLVEEVNGLLMQQEKDLECARGRAADLAHGLKTPLAALAADVRLLRERGDHDLAGRITEISETMRRHVERELARARIRGRRSLRAPASAPLRPLAETLVSIQKRTAAGQRLTFEINIAEGSEVAMDKADLAEVLGNLLENAARHARSHVRIGAEGDGRVAIEDDGPGIPESLRVRVLERGGRLDEKPGSAGLGLAIVQEVLDAYDRRLTLGTSPMGGLSVTF